MPSSDNSWTPQWIRWWAAPTPPGPPGRLLARWLFLRALGGIYFSAFFSLIFQVRGLIGADGLLPAGQYLEAVAEHLGPVRYWYVPTVYWISANDGALMFVCWAGIVASLLLLFNILPRAMLVVCFVAFLSFVSAAQDFSGYQSDGMLLCAGFLSIFFAPAGLRPRYGENSPPPRAPWILLQFLWFTIYFESGAAKYLGGDPEWRNFTALYDYYQNGPLPTWIAWYAALLPHWFQYSMAFFTLALELGLVWMVLFPRRVRIVCFWIVTIFQIGLILTANYTFLNYLVLSLGILLLDDKYLVRFVPQRWTTAIRRNLDQSERYAAEPSHGMQTQGAPDWKAYAKRGATTLATTLSALLVAWVGYAMLFVLLQMFSRKLPLPNEPVVLLDGFRIANQYGLFGRMTLYRYEIELQGSNDDGETWRTYGFRFKPQDVAERPGIYAPYQPRFDWNLWFASLGTWRENIFVLRLEQQILRNSPAVLALFRSNPFPDAPPTQIRAIIWQYWFTDWATKRQTGNWWRREELGLYAPALERAADGSIRAYQLPGAGFPAP